MEKQKEKKKERNVDDSNVAADVKYGVDASFSSWSKPICNPDTCITRIRMLPKNTASFQRWTPWMGTDKPANTYLSPPRASP
jgi:hypothetical protein